MSATSSRFKELICLIALMFCLNVGAAEKNTYCQPDMLCWPSESHWAKLNKQVDGRLIKTTPYLQACTSRHKILKLLNISSDACLEALENAKNPYYLEDHPEATQISGMYKAWKAETSPYVVAAETVDDITAAVHFARENNIRIAIKGTGHDYLGRSNAADSLLIWTHKMHEMTMHDSFVPQGCSNTESYSQAISVGAGTVWSEAYDMVTNKHRRYVQGGNCTTVGVAGGFMQGGGFGVFSKKFGLGADSLLEAEVVTADGKVYVANGCQNQDLWWALRGGGGGTFGIVTKVTLKTHELPENFGALDGKIFAKNDAAFLQLIEFMLNFSRENIINEHWGKGFSIRKDNSINLYLQFQGLDKQAVKKVWSILEEWISLKPDLYTMNFNILSKPAQKEWNYTYQQKYFPHKVHIDTRTNQPEGQFWWANHQSQVGLYLYAYETRWIPEKLFNNNSAEDFSRVLFDVSRHWSMSLQFNKGMAGGAVEAIASQNLNSINPEVYNSAAMIFMVTGQKDTFSGVPGHEPDIKSAERKINKINTAMKILRKATPGAGTYSNEASYFEPKWQQSFWGINYSRLLKIKKKYDPDNLFTCHHCVGSDI